MAFEKGIAKITKNLEVRERALDKVMNEGRRTVRECSKAIKSIHAKDMKKAKAHLKNAEKLLPGIRKYETEFPHQVSHVLQEYVETIVVLSAVEKKKLPSFSEMGVNEAAYLNGYLDAVGELKREMYEALRAGRKKEAERYFKMMEEVYDAFLPISFSNSVLPEFRRKQDVARIQIEQARGELL